MLSRPLLQSIPAQFHKLYSRSWIRKNPADSKTYQLSPRSFENPTSWITRRLLLACVTRGKIVGMASQPMGTNWQALIIVLYVYVISTVLLIIFVISRTGWRFSLRGWLITMTVLAPPLWLLVYVAKSLLSAH